MKGKKTENILLGYLIINFIKIKFESVWELIKDTFDIFLLSERVNLSQVSQMINSQFLTTE